MEDARAFAQALHMFLGCFKNYQFSISRKRCERYNTMYLKSVSVSYILMFIRLQIY